MPNQMQLNLKKDFCSLTFSSAHEKFDGCNVPEGSFQTHKYGQYFTKNLTRFGNISVHRVCIQGSYKFCSHCRMKVFFLRYIDKHFPPGHKLHKIVNRSSAIVSYNCVNNIKSKITWHNARIIRRNHTQDTIIDIYNCQFKKTCPLRNQCITKNNVCICLHVRYVP